MPNMAPVDVEASAHAIKPTGVAFYKNLLQQPPPARPESLKEGMCLNRAPRHDAECVMLVGHTFQYTHNDFSRLSFNVQR
jgi:hypothetical protein